MMNTETNAPATAADRRASAGPWVALTLLIPAANAGLAARVHGHGHGH